MVDINQQEWPDRAEDQVVKDDLESLNAQIRYPNTNDKDKQALKREATKLALNYNINREAGATAVEFPEHLSPEKKAELKKLAEFYHGKKHQTENDPQTKETQTSPARNPEEFAKNRKHYVFP